ncbi:MAG TPA: tetratricopeptide repeat protein, partial [Candidatus Paceibacterota bacterium]
LAPQNNDARVIYAAGAIYVGDSQLLNTLLTEGDGPTLTSDPRLIQAYIRVGQFAQARTLLEKKISLNPQDWQSHLSLAGVYLQLGERQKAITEIQQVITLNTEFKAQGEYLIQEIQAGRNP